MSWYRRLINTVRQDSVSRDIEREMSFHVSELVEELVTGGMSEADAQLEARRRFGNRPQMGERVREVDLARWLESVLADVKYAIRALRARPGFTAIAILSLGLGIGANTAIFSLVNAVMLRSLPVQDPGALVQITSRDGMDNFTNPIWEQLRDHKPGLAGVLATSPSDFTLSDGGIVRRAAGAYVSGSYFNVLGVAPEAGRLLNESDDARGCAGAAVLSDDYWRREYGGANVVGQTISITGHPMPIVGVAAPGFTGVSVGRREGIFLPICMTPVINGRPDMLDARSMWFLDVLGRLPAGGTPEEATARLAVAARPMLEAVTPPTWSPKNQRDFQNAGFKATAAPTGVSQIRGEYRGALYTLLGVVAVVLLIACANVAQLLLARATSRKHEVAVRMALGSGRGRLVRQLLTESVLLSLTGAAVGVLFARWASALIVRMLSQSGRLVGLDLSIDMRVLGFTVAVATITGVLFGLVPAWHATRVAPLAAMRGAGRGLVGRGRQRFARGLVAGQVALSLTLVAAAGLLIGSFHRLSSVDPGFRRDGVLVVRADWTRMEIDSARQRAFIRQITDRARAIPGVQTAGASLLTPIGNMAWNEEMVAEGFPARSGPDALVWLNGVSDGYMTTLGTHLLAGRDFTAGDGGDAPKVALVNATFAKRFFGEASPLGHIIKTRFNDKFGPALTVVGVVEDTKYQRVNEEQRALAYTPLPQSEIFGHGINLLIRTSGSPAALTSSVTSAMREVNPQLSLEIQTLDDQVAASLTRPRLLATLSGFFGALALLLAVIGLYGTMSYSVASRRNEIGVRIALGAARSGILGMVAGEAGLLVGLGVVAGTAIALAATRLVAGFLYGVTATDPATLAFSALALTTVALGAGLVPAWRAAGVDPTEALRGE